MSGRITANLGGGIILIEGGDIGSLCFLINFPNRPGSFSESGVFAYYSGRNIDTIVQSPAAVIVCHVDLKCEIEIKNITGKTIVLSDNPQLLFSQIACRKYGELLQPKKRWTCNPDGSQPRNSFIQAGAMVYDNVTIGDNCTIAANAVIGDAGFGFSRDSNGEFVSMPHFGGVTIGNSVEIGPGSVIDCGTFGNTIIESNIRIDNMVQIAHNVTIASGTRIMAGVSISGGVQIGRDCWIAPKAMLRDKIKIGNNVLIGCSSMVTIDIPDNHKYQPAYAEIHKTAADHK
ncbi:MAG: hypothetical protein IIA17_01820 [candidate division Zixibacteria bacterium]|nr:hypothetical protein [candidate division Zixibacteria bacterium]